MSLGSTGRIVLAQLGKCGWRSLPSRRLSTFTMAAPQDTHPAKKLKTAETKKVTNPSPNSMVTGLTYFCASFRSSVHTTAHFTAMKPWRFTCSGKHRPTPMQVCYVDPLLRSLPLKPPFGRLDPNERPGNVGYLRYSGGRRGRVR